MELKDLQKIDVKRMYEIYDKWPEIARKSYKNTEVNSSFDKVEHIATVSYTHLTLPTTPYV